MDSNPIWLFYLQKGEIWTQIPILREEELCEETLG